MFTNPRESVVTIDEGEYFSSNINVCPGSTPTLVSSSRGSVQSEEVEEESSNTSGVAEEEQEESLIDWGSDSTWPDINMLPGTWGTQGLANHPWNDKERPCAKFRKYQDIQLNDFEYRGILTDRVIASCSSYLDRSPEFGKYVICKVELSKKLLTDISLLAYHHYIQYVDLSWNELADVGALENLPFLMYLDVSHNFLSEILDFKAPFYLTYVNYSNNLIRHINDLSEFWSIVHLDLSHNHIKVIGGLDKLKYLRHLNLSYNVIECIENLNCMKLQTLNLMRNNIFKFEEGGDVGLKTLIDLLHIDVSFNRLKSLKLFEGIPGIQSINAVGNLIDDLMEITYLRDLNFLTEVDFRENPIVNKNHYVEACITTIKYLYMLDGDFVDAEKKIIVRSNFKPSPMDEAIKLSSKILFLQQINDPVLGQPVVTADHAPPPIVILVGPPGSGKATFLKRFCEEHKRYTILGVSHTTRKKTDDEVENESYYFISGKEFCKMAHSGEFLAVSHTLGKFYGFAQTEMAKTVGKFAVLMLRMDLTGALTLRAKGFPCRLLLTIPSTREVHKKQLLQKYYNHQQYYKYLGAVEIENCPTKTERRKSEQAICMRPSVTLLAKNIVNELLDDALRDKDEEGRVSDSSRSSKTTGSVDSGKIMGSNSRAFGILKVPSARFSNKATNAELPRASVTFQETTEIFPPSTLTNYSQNRSVTFGDVTESDVNPPIQSISGTLLRDEDPVLLSVLSTAHIDENREIYEDTMKLWDTQNEALDAVVDEILNSRDTYLHTHHTNPGLFTAVIFTDNHEEAWYKLKEVVKDCINTQESAKPYYEYQKDSVYTIMVATRLKELHKEIRGQLSITQEQMHAMKAPIKSEHTIIQPEQSQKEIVEKMRKHRQKAFSYKLPTEHNYARRRSSSFSEDNEQPKHDDTLHWVNP